MTRAHGCRGTPIQALNLVVDGEAGNSHTSRRAGRCGSPGRRRGGADPQPYPLLPCLKGRCGTACAPLRAGREGEEEASGLRVGGQRP